MNATNSVQSRFSRDIDQGLRSKAKFARLGLLFLTAGGLMVLGVGVAALLTAVSIILLPHEQHYLHSSVTQLQQHHHDGSLVNFIIHNRVAFAGTLMAIGGLYCWLIWGPIKEGKSWGWWALFLSCLGGAGSYFSFLSSGYVDGWHGAGTAVIMFSLFTGLTMTWPHVSSSQATVHWPRSERWARLLLLVWAGATLSGGLIILGLGMVTVFVPQDLEFMQTTTAGLQSINKHLVSFMAHDRTGFGGALIAIGVVTCTAVWQTKTLVDRSLLITLSFVWLMDVLTAIGIHFVVGYVSLTHLLPFLLKDIAFLAGLRLLFRIRGQST
jgi:hypothetical protein